MKQITNIEEKIIIIKDFLKTKGWYEDSCGNLKIESSDGTGVSRMNFGKISIRYERKDNIKGSRWFRIRKEYYRNLYIMNDKLYGL